jgi:hypothetical protein
MTAAVWVIESVETPGQLLLRYQQVNDTVATTKDEAAVIAFSDPADALEAIAALPERHRSMWRVRKKKKA